MPERALIVGSSDGIGLALTRALLERHWQVSGLSRSPAPLAHASYAHVVSDVRSQQFEPALDALLRSEPFRLVVYSAGIGEPFDAARMPQDVATLETNLLGLVKTAAIAVPHLRAHAPATLVGLSSLADVLRSAASPAYGASKAGMSHYLESLAQALRGSGVHVVNVRLGFVNTKMAKANVKPWLLEPADAAARILRGVLVASPPRRLNIPRRAAVAVQLARLVLPYVSST